MTATTLATQMYIDDQWCNAASGKSRAIINPATEETVATVTWGDRIDAKRALEAAQRALPGWMKLTSWERAKLIRKVADLIRERADIISRTLTTEQGKPLAEAKAETLHAADTWEWFAEEAKRAYGQVIPNSAPGKRHLTIKHPVGVCATISPFNFPVAMQARKIAPALAAGCTVVARPADQTPLSLIHIFQCIADAGFPSGVVNLVIGDGPDMGMEFTDNPICRKISFTGSTAVGKELARRCVDQMKRTSLELGGHAPFIIMPDADPEAGAKMAVAGKFRNNGQVCIAPSRFFVHRDLRKKFIEAVVETARALKIGNGLDAGIELGPMISAPAMQKATALVDDAKSKGSKILLGGNRSTRFDRGYFYEPTVISDLPQSARILTEEPFAPVMPLMEFDKIDEVIAAANNTRYGLAAFAFTNDLSLMWKLAEGIEAGIIGINDPTPATPQCPFGGMKESGIGRELAHEGLESYLETKYISMKIRE